MWRVYNVLVKKRNQVRTDISDINIQLKRKIELVDKLISLVKDYAKHEKETYENVAKARSAIDTSKTASDTAKVENMLTETLRSLMVVVEDYPKLQANESYQQLQLDLKEIEDRIAQYREEYNITVQKYNNRIQTFPNLLIASLLGFKEEYPYQLAENADTK